MDEDPKVPVMTRLAPSTVREIDQIRQVYGLTRSTVLRMLLRQGLLSYQKEGWISK